MINVTKDHLNAISDVVSAIIAEREDEIEEALTQARGRSVKLTVSVKITPDIGCLQVSVSDKVAFSMPKEPVRLRLDAKQRTLFQSEAEA